eukprot:364902-Chlamydomonas_euryale.AAC.25
MSAARTAYPPRGSYGRPSSVTKRYDSGTAVCPSAPSRPDDRGSRSHAGSGGGSDNVIGPARCAMRTAAIAAAPSASAACARCGCGASDAYRELRGASARARVKQPSAAAASVLLSSAPTPALRSAPVAGVAALPLSFPSAAAVVHVGWLMIPARTAVGTLGGISMVLPATFPSLLWL